MHCEKEKKKAHLNHPRRFASIAAIYFGRRNVTKNLLSICAHLGEKKMVSPRTGIHEGIYLAIGNETADSHAQDNLHVAVTDTAV